MGTFNDETPEKILHLVTNFDKTIIITGTTLLVKDIYCGIFYSDGNYNNLIFCLAMKYECSSHP